MDKLYFGKQVGWVILIDVTDAHNIANKVIIVIIIINKSICNVDHLYNYSTTLIRG